MAAGVRTGSMSRRAGGQPGGAPASRDGEIVVLQRARLLSAAVGLLAERGYESFSAAALCVRAGVSRRTFYEIFDDGEACLVAILQDAEALVAHEMELLDLERLDWRERVRLGLWVILCIAEASPALATACLIECQRAGGLVQRERERILQRLIACVDQGRALSTPAASAGALTAEALVGAALSVIAARIANTTRQAEPRGRTGSGLRGLLGELMGMIVLPYEGPAAARRQIERDLPDAPVSSLTGVNAEGPDPLAGLRMRLTYRTARVLRAIAALTETETRASNRQIAKHAGISDAGQASKLLWRLAQHGLLENTATGNHAKGEANQWRLTQAGRRVLQSITIQVGAHKGRRAA